MIRLVDVTQHYGVRPVLRHINLQIETGELVSVLGPNGTGKTTLLGVMAGVLQPQKGYVEIDGDRLMDHTERLLRLFDLSEQGDWPIRSYSNGQQKKIAISGALVTEAPVMLLDEPFSGGLDPSGILALKHVLQHLAANRDITVVMAAPVPELVEEVSDRIVVLQEGEVLAFDTVDGLRARTNTSGPLAEALQRLIHRWEFRRRAR